MAGDISRQANSTEVKGLRSEARELKECVAELTLKNRVLLENYFLPGDLERQIESFVEHYNHERYHESLNNVTPADVYFGRAQSILNRRERIKAKTIEHRRLQYRKAVA